MASPLSARATPSSQIDGAQVSVHHPVSWGQNHPHETPWTRLWKWPVRPAFRAPQRKGTWLRSTGRSQGTSRGLECAELSTRTCFWPPGPWRAELPAPRALAPSPQRLLGPAAFLALQPVLGKRPAGPQGRGSLPPLVKGPGPGAALTWADCPQGTSVLVTLGVLPGSSGWGWGQCPGRPWTSTVLRGRRPAFSVWEDSSLIPAHTGHRCKGPAVRGYKPG